MNSTTSKLLAAGMAVCASSSAQAMRGNCKTSSATGRVGTPCRPRRSRGDRPTGFCNCLMLNDDDALKAAREPLAKMTFEEKCQMLGGSAADVRGRATIHVSRDQTFPDRPRRTGSPPPSPERVRGDCGDTR